MANNVMTDKDAPTTRPDGEPDDENEVLRETRRLRELEAAAVQAEKDREPDKRPVNWKTAAGIGIGSAALLAAVLYATRDRD